MNSNIADLSLASYGEKKIQWAWRNMPVLNAFSKQYEIEKPLSGLRITVSVHVEAKTACLARVLERAGAQVALTGCNPLSTQDDVAAALVAGGMRVYARHGVGEEEYTQHLREALSFEPNIIIDDGGDLVQLLLNEPELASKVIGGCEETTTGVHRLHVLEKEGKLQFPMLAVNDARCKHLFDNRYGTGQSTWTAIMATTNLIVAGKTVVVAGYGMCGKGIAKRALGLGARVIVTEIDPICAAEALMDGCAVMTMDEAAPLGDVFVTVTGCRDVIIGRHFVKMKEGAILCNAGHFDVEVNVAELRTMAEQVMESRNNITSYVINGRTLHLLAEGRLVNLAAGDGHPAEIMDMSFALQAAGTVYMACYARQMEKKVYDMPAELDMLVASTLLNAKGIAIDKLSDEQEKYLQFCVAD